MSRVLNIVDGVNGAVFIYDVEPQNPEDNVSNKVFSEDGKVLKSFLTNTDLLKFKIFAITGNSNYKPIVKIKDNIVDLTEIEKAYFIGEINIDTLHFDDITAKHEDGAKHTVLINYETAPVITELQFINDYPNNQTELKENDNFDIYIKADKSFNKVYIYDFEACKETEYNIAETTEITVTGVIANRGDIAQNLHCKVKVYNINGTASEEVISSNTVVCNNLHPTITIDNITYPTGQQALKNDEQAIVYNTVTDFDTILYSSNGEIDIANIDVYESEKIVTRIVGDYNITNNNFIIKATRLANGAVTEFGKVVNIANVFADIKMINPQPFLRSGGNDNTAIQQYIIKLESNQKLLETPIIDDLENGKGTWISDFETTDNINFYRTMQVTDNDEKGTFYYTGLQAKNLAGLVTTAFNSAYNTYILQGFVKRNITLQAYENEANMNVAAVNYDNVIMTWSVKNLPIKEQVGTTTTPIANAWCLNSLYTNPTIIRILDTSATSNSSQPSIIEIEEVI